MVQTNRPTFALITSACSKTGRLYANELAERGINLLLLDFDSMGLSELAIELEQKNIIVHCFEFDFLKREQFHEFSKWIQQGFKIKMLVNIASFECKGSFLASQIEYIHHIFQMNIRSTNNITKLVIPILLQQKDSVLLNVSSLGDISLLNYKTVYKSSRQLIKQYTELLQEELKNKGLKVKWIDLGYQGKQSIFSDNLNFINRFVSFNFRSPQGLVIDSIKTITTHSFLKSN